MPHRSDEPEDLLAEATALVERISLRVAGQDDDVVVGFRREHSASFYFGSDCVYQFTSDGKLRRALVGELLFKAEQRQLVSLHRETHEHAVELLRHVLDSAETQQFLARMREQLEWLHHALAKRNFSIAGQVPANADLVSRVDCWLDEFAGRIEIAASPRVA
jgi:hypothetical protein